MAFVHSRSRKAPSQMIESARPSFVGTRSAGTVSLTASAPGVQNVPGPPGRLGATSADNETREQPGGEMDQELRFEDRAALRKWLEENHDSSNGVWLVFEKGRNAATVAAGEALEEALCFGWIDGQYNRIDDFVYHKRFTPRRKGSRWSERNRKIAEQLIGDGRMAEAGIRAIDEAKRGGTWETRRPPPISEAQVRTLDEALSSYRTAQENFRNMSASVRRTYAALYLSAKKEETRVRRLQKIVDRLEKNLKPM